MTDREALYRAIIVNPSEDTPRLVYADWLQENDRPEEAEFIRLGCRLEASSPDHPEYVEWLARHGELTIWLAAHSPGPKLKFPAGLEVSGEADWWRISRRGFPRYIEFDGNHHPSGKAIRSLAASLETAFDTLPTRWLVVRFITNEQLAELLRQPIIGQLDTLTLQLYSQGEPNVEAARLLANCSHLKNLRGLVLAFDIGIDGAEVLGQSENLRGLERLTISGPTVTPISIRSLGAAAWFRNLCILAVDDLPDGSFEELCGLVPFRRLHTLRVNKHELAVLAWETFATSKTFPSLASLEFERVNMSGGGIEALAGAKWFRPCRLDLNYCSIGNEGAEALSGASWLASLRWLGMRGNLLSPSGVVAITRNRTLTELKYLDLSNNEVGVSGLHAIASNPALRGLIALDLTGHGHYKGQLTQEHVRAFLAQLKMPQLRHLLLGGRPVGAKAARGLANEKFASLTRLALEDCQLTDSAVRALLEAPALQGLIELRLNDNKLKVGVEPLTNPRIMPRLGSCDISGAKISDNLEGKLRKRPGVVIE
ncbi:MAG: TIGR02996 domain-containing protein [Planctomycetes bacterium]|nr:TIGR02996 domain-containing protein [Planctomycetota bacterium]